MGCSLIGDDKLLIFSGFVFRERKLKDWMIKSWIKAVLTFGVAVKQMVAAADVHGDFGNDRYTILLVIFLDKLA